MATPASTRPSAPASVAVNDIAGLRRILGDCRRIAMVGLSANWYRPSFFAAKYLLDHGYDVVPVNPRYEAVLGQTCYPDLASIPGSIDLVDCFRRSEEIGPLAEEAIAIGARVLWMQLGVVNEAAAKVAHQAGLEVVMDRCMKIEYARIFGGLNLVGVNTKVISGKRPLHITR